MLTFIARASLIAHLSLIGCGDPGSVLEEVTSGELSAGVGDPPIAGLPGTPVAGESMAGESVAGEPTAGDPVAGESVAGESMAGEAVAGEPVAGEPVAGEPVAGEPVAGEPVAGEPIAGEPVAGEPIAGEPVAGEPVAGEPIAGEPVAGEPVAGEPVAGEPVAGGTPPLELGDACDPDFGEEGGCPVDQGAACVQGRCTLVIPQINTFSASGRDGVLFLNLDASDQDRDTLFFNLTLYNALGEVVPISDDEESYRGPLPNEIAPIFTGLAEINATIRIPLERLPLATEVEITLEDVADHFSAPARAVITPHPVLGLGDACDEAGFSGFCDVDARCAEGPNGEFVCSRGTAPVARAARLSVSSNSIVLSAIGSDEDGDIISMDVKLYDVFGESLLEGDALGVTRLGLTRSRPDDGALEGELRYYTVIDVDLGGVTLAELITQTAAAELSLVDVTQQVSETLLVVRSEMPTRGVGEVCDEERFDDVCSEGLCRLDIASGETRCRVGGGQLGEICEDALPCNEGFTCYSAENSGGFTQYFNTCLRACDANTTPDGCAPNELCLPDFDWRGAGFPDRESPGICLPSDECVPERAAETCGVDEASCLRAGNISLCIDLSAYPPNLVAQLGEECAGFATPCAEGSVCELGVCRAACDADSADACGEGESCQPLDRAYYSNETDSFDVCWETCDIVTQECADANEGCILYASDSNAEALTVCAETVAGESTRGDICNPALNDGYWGDCTSDHFCGALFNGQANTCNAFCTPEDSSRCVDQVCLPDVFGSTGVGLCAGDCDALSEGECDAEQSCNLGIQGVSSIGTTEIKGICIDNPSVGTHATGAVCVEDDFSTTGSCASGHLCADLTQSGISTCVRLCQEGQVISPCEANQVCVTQTANGPLFGEDLDQLGVCF